mmetsp:Transcript_13127/g.16581  ORF Transcript_13127/g.16581 Transcript_13127/m.16581 type:complete len:271 (+) Transcript_13127:116-928(+)|eukprot:CAMPEP_0172517354 /NCGR_PEP_ID=MMETSP1066-20121228/284472_1 /TAXON_ID=671091 /ORGANISM="Coscinodiscus wailesii, Strain CCMP2513" /LENGTH=270 /DNA_ID=CAMNT_0013299321 /DNA_START=99 /DNA_END=911 /DNA_ORIENTATION=+
MTPRQQNQIDDEDVSEIYLIRHGDRYDYANPSWAETAKETSNLTTDPPLSPLGHRQAKETATFLTSVKASHIFSSPYLRVIQTACPTSDTLKIPIAIEPGLSEAHATPGALPTSAQRYAYFPQIDPHHEAMITVTASPGRTCQKTGLPCEAFAGHYVTRVGQLRDVLEDKFRGKTIVCFSHAASVALVAALLRRGMEEFKFAPCGVYRLRRIGDGPWEMLRSGACNEGYVSENSDTTYPWGLAEKHFEEDCGGKYQGSSEGIGLDYFVRP